MKRTVPFFLATLIFGWILQALFLYWVPAGLPTPHWFLLAVLALGAQGRTRFAMTVGFVGGLSLDAYGISAFGVQGWLLALAGYVSGTFSKNLNAEKLGTQAALTVFASALVWAGVRLLSGFFDHSLVGHPGLGLSLVQIGLNTLVAPGVFWLMGVWGEYWDPRPLDGRA
jgi:rod shape-determining protein MreD